MFSFIFGLILAIPLGALTGFGARAALPGTQNIGLSKTIGVGIAANFLTNLFLGAIIGFFLSLIVGIAVGAGLIYVGINKGYLGPASGELNA